MFSEIQVKQFQIPKCREKMDPYATNAIHKQQEQQTEALTK